MEFTATARFTRVSPQKARLVLDLIKGQRVERAMDQLTFSSKRIAPQIARLLRSAVENANYLSNEKGLDVDVDNLYVKNAIANEGPRMKRIRPAPMGRAFRYQRRLAHLSITLAEKSAGNGVTVTAAPAAAAAPKKAAKKTGARSPARKTAAKKAPAKKFAGKK